MCKFRGPELGQNRAIFGPVASRVQPSPDSIISSPDIMIPQQAGLLMPMFSPAQVRDSLATICLPTALTTL